MTIPQILFCIDIILFLFTVFVLWWLGAPQKNPNVRFAWWPIRLWREERPNVWLDTYTWAWLEHVGIHKTMWGDDLHFRLR